MISLELLGVCVETFNAHSNNLVSDGPLVRLTLTQRKTAPRPTREGARWRGWESTAFLLQGGPFQSYPSSWPWVCTPASAPCRGYATCPCTW
eukprot:5887896-Amphidinium_carterae.2